MTREGKIDFEILKFNVQRTQNQRNILDFGGMFFIRGCFHSKESRKNGKLMIQFRQIWIR